MKISLSQLDTLCAVAERGSFSKAARALGISQPAVSQQLATLATALGLTLFSREDGRPALTEAGQMVVARARALLADTEALLREAEGYAAARSGHLDFAATRTIGTHLVPQLLAVFLRDRPGVEPRVRIANTHEVAQLVLRGESLFGLVEGAIEEPQLETRPFAHDHLRLIVPPQHPFAGRSELHAAELARERFVSREPGSGTRDHGYDALRAAGIEPPIALELPSGEGIVRAVEAGLGIAVLSELVVERAISLHRVVAVAIDDLALERNFFVLSRRDRPLAPLARAFITSLLGEAENDGSKGSRSTVLKQRRRRSGR
ncbi:MAG: LysR family transcriptional regulator [Candidatus Eremiobacteraeota bacterium]|nr:LysR family transcriptional regulator [Candidatus Eremiobacteraeota bacterium]NNM91963.1 LysR family transcriptional regulator [Candidatus Eremiobacteraeota bacterium]